MQSGRQHTSVDEFYFEWSPVILVQTNGNKSEVSLSVVNLREFQLLVVGSSRLNPHQTRSKSSLSNKCERFQLAFFDGCSLIKYSANYYGSLSSTNYATWLSCPSYIPIYSVSDLSNYVDLGPHQWIRWPSILFFCDGYKEELTATWNVELIWLWSRKRTLSHFFSSS